MKNYFNWNKIKASLTLKNFTIVSVFLIVIAFFFEITYPQTGFPIFLLGLSCFALAYFIYAVKTWGSNRKISALFMVAVPLLAYFFSTTKIPNTITNIAFYLFIQFCFYAIISAILLFISDKVKVVIEKYILRKKKNEHRYFLPNTTYSILGIGIISILLVGFYGYPIFSDNANTIFSSVQNYGTPSHTNVNVKDPIPSTNVQNPQIIPTIEPEIIQNFQDSINPPPPTVDPQTLERQVHELINQQRRNNGLSALSFDSTLALIARRHSEDMAQNNYFAHENLQGLDPSGRGDLVGYSCRKNYGSYYTFGIAENIFQNNLYDSVTYYNGIPSYDWNTQGEIAQSTVSGWMSSPGHRQNILTSTYDRQGIGVAIAGDDKVYITEDFC